MCSQRFLQDSARDQRSGPDGLPAASSLAGRRESPLGGRGRPPASSATAASSARPWGSRRSARVRRSLWEWKDCSVLTGHSHTPAAGGPRLTVADTSGGSLAPAGRTEHIAHAACVGTSGPASSRHRASVGSTESAASPRSCRASRGRGRVTTPSPRRVPCQVAQQNSRLEPHASCTCAGPGCRKARGRARADLGLLCLNPLGVGRTCPPTGST